METTAPVRAALAILLFAASALASPPPESPGEVRLPLEEFNELREAARAKAPRTAPADFAVGNATVEVTVSETAGRATARIEASMKVNVLESDWVSVPLLPPGTPVLEATVAGKAVELLSTVNGLEWTARSAGEYDVRLSYAVDAQGSDFGFAAGIPLPLAPSSSFTARLPGSGLDATLIPSAGSRVTSSGDRTVVTAIIPAATGAQLSWRAASKLGYSMSRAIYKGSVSDDSVSWSGELSLEIFGDEPVTLQVLPQTVTLSDMKVDGKPSPILVDGGRFAAILKGRGAHQLTVDFRVPVSREQGAPRVLLPVRPIPVTRIDLALPGNKKVQISPSSDVTYRNQESQTIATAFVPMSEEIAIVWSEAIPEETEAELRADASVYHAVHAEEGLLAVRAMVQLDISRGATNRVAIGVPEGVDVSRVSSTSGMLADWRVSKAPDGSEQIIEAFFDRQVGVPIGLELEYDVALDKKEHASGATVPLLDVKGVRRQRGMIALLASREIALKPSREKDLTRVGENQLPAAVRETITHTVAHTYRYVDGAPILAVQTATPERVQGRFDAVVDTLVSLSDVSLKGSATVELNVKSGAIASLELEAPGKVNILNLTAPSLRGFKVRTEGEKQVIDVQFTQDMEGQFRAEVAYELIMEDHGSDTKVPTVLVRGAEVEQGRIAIEALSAVEVQPAASVSLSTLDPNELPRQLVLKTTNPILLGYKYVKVDPPYELRLRITRHREIETQSAVIDMASYKTLYTKDGLAVTTAIYTVRNTNNQFLRLRLPEGSQVWNVSVGGSPEKPALSETKSESGEISREVLIKIINSSQGFPVAITYQTPVAKIGTFGTVTGTLPRPDMIATSTRWEVFLPDDLEYFRPRTNMNVSLESEPFSRGAIHAIMNETEPGKQPEGAVLSVPAAGVKYTFEKLYANQSEDEAYFAITYASGAFGIVMQFVLAAAAAGLIAALASGVGLAGKLKKERATALAIVSLALLGIAMFLGIGRIGAGLGALGGLLYLVSLAQRRKWRGGTNTTMTEEPLEEGAE